MTIDGGLVSILIYILIIGAVGWFAFWLIDRMGVPNPFHWIIKLIVGIILLIALLNVLGVIGGVKIAAIAPAALMLTGFA